MKNILEEKPTDKLRARQIESIKFIAQEDIKGKTILDIGCGYGWFELEMIKGKMKKVYGIEISQDDLRAAKKIKSRKVDFKVGHALKIPFGDKSFDTVVAWEVIEHIPKNTEIKMVREVNRVLKNNGSFYLSTPYDSILSKFSDPAWWLIGHRHYNEASLTYFAKGNGFKVDTIIKMGKIWSLVLILDFYFSKWILRRSVIFNDYLSKKESREYKEKKGFLQIFVKYVKKEDKG